MLVVEFTCAQALNSLYKKKKKIKVVIINVMCIIVLLQYPIWTCLECAQQNNLHLYNFMIKKGNKHARAILIKTNLLISKVWKRLHGSTIIQSINVLLFKKIITELNTIWNWLNNELKTNSQVTHFLVFCLFFFLLMHDNCFNLKTFMIFIARSR